MSETVHWQHSPRRRSSAPCPVSSSPRADLTRRYGEGDTAVDALRGVSLDVPKGQLTAVMGPSGSGKSTLMHILAGLDKPTSGEVTIAGTAISTLSDSDLTKLRRQHIGFIFQFFNLLPMLTAEENVLLPLSIAGVKPDRGMGRRADRAASGLTDRRKHRPSELSGGQQQRVAIGRALVSRPTIVFADEPTGNLDSKTSGEILEVLDRSVQELEQTIVMVTHEARAAAIAHRVLFLADGAHRPRVERSFCTRDRRRDGTSSTARDQFRVCKALLGRKLRTVLSAFAIVLGVATVSGTYVLTDSHRQGASARSSRRAATDPTPSSAASPPSSIGDGTGVTAPAFDAGAAAEGARASGRRASPTAASTARRS